MAKKKLPQLIELVRDTTWKCGRLEREIITFIREYITTRIRKTVPTELVLQHFTEKGYAPLQIKDALARLEKRQIIRFRSTYNRGRKKNREVGR